MKTFKETVKAELDKQSKSWYWLADELGVSKGHVHNLLRKPTWDTIDRIGEVLGKKYIKTLY